MRRPTSFDYYLYYHDNVAKSTQKDTYFFAGLLSEICRRRVSRHQRDHRPYCLGRHRVPRAHASFRPEPPSAFERGKCFCPSCRFYDQGPRHGGPAEVPPPLYESTVADLGRGSSGTPSSQGKI